MRPATACRGAWSRAACAPPAALAARRPGSRCSARRRCRSSPAPPWRCRPPGAASAADSHCPARRRRRDSAARSSGRRRYACRQGKPGPGNPPWPARARSSADRRGTRHGSGPAAPGAAPAPSRSGTAWRAARRQSARAAYRRWCCRPADWERPARSAFAAESPVPDWAPSACRSAPRPAQPAFHRAGSPRRAPPRDCRFPRSCDPREKSGRARTASGWCSGKCSGIRCCCLVRSGTGIQHLRPGALRIRAAARRRRAGWSPPGRRPGSGCGETGHQTASHQK